MKGMNNKRQLKKTINYACSELFAECMAATLYGKSNAEDAKAVMASIMDINYDFINRVSHPEPGMKAAVYYRSLVNDFIKQTDEIIDQIRNLG